MNYLDCRKIIEENDLELSIPMEIALCVSASISGVEGEVPNEMFSAICGYVRAVWDKVERTYTQLIADIVVDCVYHCFDYYQCKHTTLNFYQLLNLDLLDEIISIYYDKYND